MKKFFFNNDGSLTLEATIAFPVFLGLILLLINFINIGMIHLAMDHATGEATKQIAAHAYSLKYFDSLTRRGEDTVTQLTPIVSSYIGMENRNKIKGVLTQKLLNSLIEELAEKKIREMYPLGNLDKNDFEIKQVIMYDPTSLPVGKVSLNNRILNNEDIAVVVKYDVKLLMPFFSLQEVTLSNTAVERAWRDDF